MIFLFPFITLFQIIFKGFFFLPFYLFQLIVPYKLLKGKGSKLALYFLLISLTIEIILFILGISNFIYLILYSILFFIYIFHYFDEKKFDEFNKLVRKYGYKWRKYYVYYSFEGNFIEKITNLYPSILGISRNKLALLIFFPKTPVFRIYNTKEIQPYLRYFEKEKDLYYIRIRDLFIPSGKIKSSKEPKLRNYVIEFLSKDEKFFIYEDIKTLFSIIKDLGYDMGK